MSSAIFWLLLVGIILHSSLAAIPRKRFLGGFGLESTASADDTSLYNAADKVVKLNIYNFNETILEQNRSALVEFYNSFCGHCKRFAPKYKELAADLRPWRDVVIISAIDCADQKNIEICAQYEVGAYPTLRYMGPDFRPAPGHVGHKIETQNLDEIRVILAQKVAAENTSVHTGEWPNFEPLTSSEVPDLGKKYDYVAVVREPENSIIGIETILYLLPWAELEVRRIRAAEPLVGKLAEMRESPIGIIDKAGKVTPLTPSAQKSRAFADAIAAFLEARGIKPRVEVTEAPLELIADAKKEQMVRDRIAIVREHKSTVYRADLELAIRNILHGEIPKKGKIEGPALVALQDFLAVLERYNPLNPIGRQVVVQLKRVVDEYSDVIPSGEFLSIVERFKDMISYPAEMYVGCIGSKSSYRGYTCSLWQLFHYMSVQAALDTNTTADSNEVLRAMHGFVIHFFGCTDCANHFKAMSEKRKIFDVVSKDEAVLWLWEAHNEVNQRLAGDSTEDPEFPKVQFPVADVCSNCHQKDGSWDRSQVLAFLKHIHDPELISNYGTRSDAFPPPPHAERSYSGRGLSVGNLFFSNTDMGLSLLLYGCCIFMIVVAFKLFVFKSSYRKRNSYRERELLGKV